MNLRMVAKETIFHVICTMKEIVSHLGANLNEKNSSHCCSVSHHTQQIKSVFDEQSGISPPTIQN